MMDKIRASFVILLLSIMLVSVLPSEIFCQSKYQVLLNDPKGQEKLAALASMEENGRLDDRIRVLIRDADPLVRLRCAEALGRVDDPTGTVYYLSRLAGDEDQEVVLAALYSLGLAGHRKSTEQMTLDSIEGALKKGPLEVKLRALEALGLTRLRAASDIIKPFLKNFHSSLRSEAALALAVLGDSTAAESCINSIHDPAPQVIASVVYALGRLGCDKADDMMIPLLSSEDSGVRLRTAEALGRLEENKAIDQLSLLLSDPDRMVAIKAAEALGRIGNSKSAEKLQKVLGSDDSYLKTFALRGIAAGGGKKSFDKVVPLLEDESVMVRREAITALALLDGDKAREYLLRLYDGGNHHDRATAVEYLGKIGKEEDLSLLAGTLRSKNDHFAREGAAAGLGRWPDHEKLLEPVSEGEPSPVDILFEAAIGDDWVVAALSIDAIGKTVPEKVIGQLGSVFDKSSSRLGADIRLSVINAIAPLSKKGDLPEEDREKIISILEKGQVDTDPRVSRAAADAATGFGLDLTPDPELERQWDRGTYPWGGPALPMGNKKILMSTPKGKIEIVLFGDDAPNIVKSFLSLIEDGFYNGLDFHRVVPGFVIQGGCPRGDGWGDAGYFLRSQFNDRKYMRGTVGVAHAGKDTPGSQFFITHIPQPHLNGRYTVIGEVVRGMEVVDRIEIGDSITIKVIDGN